MVKLEAHLPVPLPLLVFNHIFFFEFFFYYFVEILEAPEYYVKDKDATDLLCVNLFYRVTRWLISISISLCWVAENGGRFYRPQKAFL